MESEDKEPQSHIWNALDDHMADALERHGKIEAVMFHKDENGEFYITVKIAGRAEHGFLAAARDRTQPKRWVSLDNVTRAAAELFTRHRSSSWRCPLLTPVFILVIDEDRTDPPLMHHEREALQLAQVEGEAVLH